MIGEVGGDHCFRRGSLWGSLFLEGVIVGVVVSGGGHCGGLCFRSRSLWWSLCLETIFLKVPEVFRLHTARSPDLCSLRMPLTSLAPVQRVQCARVQKITPAPQCFRVWIFGPARRECVHVATVGRRTRPADKLVCAPQSSASRTGVPAMNNNPRKPLKNTWFSVKNHG